MADVIVIGGGIAGCTTAYYLAKDGVDVMLLEQHDINTLASGSNAGSLHAQIQPEPFVEYGESWAGRYVAALPFYSESINLWRSAHAELGTDLAVELKGGLLVAFSSDEMRSLEAKAQFDRQGGLEIDLLDALELRSRASYVSEHAVGAAFCPLEGKADPLLAAPGFARAAKSLGVDVREHCEVTGIRRAGFEYKVLTTTEEFVASRVVLAAGDGLTRIAQMLDTNLPIRSFPIQLSVTEPLEPLVEHLVYSASEMLTLKQTAQSTVVIGGGWPAADAGSDRAAVRRDSLERNVAAAVKVVPALHNARIVRSWAAFVNGNRTWLPLIGEHPDLDGIFINYVPWMGFSGAPAAGRITAKLVQGEESPFDFDISAFRPIPGKYR